MYSVQDLRFLDDLGPKEEMSDPYPDSLKISWADVYEGQRVVWMTPRFVRRATIVRKKKRSIRIRVESSGKEYNIPDARWYYVVARHMRDRYPNEGLWVFPPDASPPISRLPDIPDDAWVTPQQAAASHSIDPKAIRRWLRAGKVIGKQTASGWLLDPVSLSQYLGDR